MHLSRTFARFSTVFYTGALVSTSIAQYYATQKVQTIVESCVSAHGSAQFDAIIHAALNVLQNRTTWLVYFVTAALVLLCMLVGFILLMRMLKTKQKKRYIDKDVPPYWFKTIRATMAMFIMYFIFSALTLVMFVPYDFMYSTIRLDPLYKCSAGVKVLHENISVVTNCLGAALILGGIASIWGFVWSLESVVHFTHQVKATTTP